MLDVILLSSAVDAPMLVMVTFGGCTINCNVTFGGCTITCNVTFGGCAITCNATFDQLTDLNSLTGNYIFFFLMSQKAKL
jgi:hypothetical protein